MSGFADAAGTFHNQAVASAEGTILTSATPVLESSLRNHILELRQKSDDFTRGIQTSQKDINRTFAATISHALEGAYRDSASQSGWSRPSVSSSRPFNIHSLTSTHAGSGSHRRMKALIHSQVDAARHHMFSDSIDAVHEQLLEPLHESEKELQKILTKVCAKLTRDYHAAIIAPQIQKLSAEQIKLKSQVDPILQRAQAELDLDELLKLGSGRTAAELSPRIRAQRNAAVKDDDDASAKVKIEPAGDTDDAAGVNEDRRVRIKLRVKEEVAEEHA